MPTEKVLASLQALSFNSKRHSLTDFQSTRNPNCSMKDLRLNSYAGWKLRISDYSLLRFLKIKEPNVHLNIHKVEIGICGSKLYIADWRTQNLKLRLLFETEEIKKRTLRKKKNFPHIKFLFRGIRHGYLPFTVQDTLQLFSQTKEGSHWGYNCLDSAGMIKYWIIEIINSYIKENL